MNTGVINIVENRAPGTAQRIRTRREAAKSLAAKSEILDTVLRELRLL